jgi:hypothetical protein
MKSFRTTAIPPVLALTITVIAGGSLVWGTAVYFSHKRHLDTGMYCPTCHTKAEGSTESADNNLPLLEVCESCHDPVPEVDQRASLTREAVFSHEMHIQKAVACTLCHRLSGDDVDARMQLPRMALCVSCHEESGETEECGACHTKLGSPELIPRSHTRQWVFAHGEDAKLDEDYCVNCHQQAFCQECHQGDNIRPKPHRRNWVYTHSIASRKGTMECDECHDPASESRCVSCHKSPMGRPRSHKRGRWITRHEEEAEGNLAACVVCHYDMSSDPLCLQCHD